MKPCWVAGVARMPRQSRAEAPAARAPRGTAPDIRRSPAPPYQFTHHQTLNPAADTQGIETVRRDNCQLVRTVVATCLERMLLHEDEAGAQAYVRATIADLLMNRLDLSLLVITKARAP